MTEELTKKEAKLQATQSGGQAMKNPSGKGWVVVNTYEQGLQERGLALQEASLGMSGEIAGAQLGLSAEQIKIAERQQKMAESQYNYWRRLYSPVERDMVRQAQAGLDPQYFADRAGTDVTAAFSKSKEGLTRDFSRLGVNPQSARLGSSMIDLEIARAVAEAGARNQARNVVNDVNYQRRMNVVQTGRNIPAQAASMSGQAAGTYGAAAGTMSAAQSGMQNATNSATNAYMGVAQSGLQADQFNRQLQEDANLRRSQANSAMWGAGAQVVGMGVGLIPGL